MQQLQAMNGRGEHCDAYNRSNGHRHRKHRRHSPELRSRRYVSSRSRSNHRRRYSRSRSRDRRHRSRTNSNHRRRSRSRSNNARNRHSRSHSNPSRRQNNKRNYSSASRQHSSNSKRSRRSNSATGSYAPSDSGGSYRRHRHQRQHRRQRHSRHRRKRTGSSRGSSRHSCSRRHSNKLAVSPQVQQDEDGHMVIQSGITMQNGRYTIVNQLGEGTFGRVVEAIDNNSEQRSKRVAVKVIRRIDKYREAAELEIRVLRELAKRDPNGEFLCVQLLSSFDYHGHKCLVFDMLGDSVFEFQKRNHYTGYPMHQVRHMAYQLVHAVKFLHDCNLTHTDLKPENILFCNSTDCDYSVNDNGQQVAIVRDSSIRLIDFGSATFDHEHHTRIVSTRHYRAPEVVLELGWSHPCDVWSIGCIIFEFYTGNCLFMTHDNVEHLAMMERSLGQPIPRKMVANSRKRSRYFTRSGDLDWSESSKAARYIRDNCRKLQQYNRQPDSEEHNQLFDLLHSLLEYRPEQRASLSQALQHAYFNALPNHLLLHKSRSSS